MQFSASLWATHPHRCDRPDRCQATSRHESLDHCAFPRHDIHSRLHTTDLFSFFNLLSMVDWRYRFHLAHDTLGRNRFWKELILSSRIAKQWLENFGYIVGSLPRWSRGHVLASRCKVRGFKPGWGRWIFSGRKKNSEHKSSRRDFKLGVPSLRFQAR